MKNDKYLRIGLAAKFLNVNPVTLRRWEKKKIITPIKIGKRLDRKYKVSDLKNILGKKNLYRIDSQKKGKTGEVILSRLLEKLFHEWNFDPIEKRTQDPGPQFGKDNISSWTGIVDNKENIRFDWSFESKHYGKRGQERVIDKDKILSKLTQIYNSNSKIDCWCIFSPFGHVDNETREIIDNRKYPFKIVLWTYQQEIEELISCFPNIYKEVYSTEKIVSEESRKRIIGKWKSLVVESTKEGKSLKAETNTKMLIVSKETMTEAIKEGLERTGINSVLTSTAKDFGIGPSPEKINSEIDKLLKLLNHEQSSEAITQFSILLGKIEDKSGYDHEKARIYNNLGVAYDLKQNTDKAIDFFKKATKQENGFIIALCNLASAYISKSETTSNEEFKKQLIGDAEKIILPLWQSFGPDSKVNIIQVYMRIIRAKYGIKGLVDFIEKQNDNYPAKLFNSNNALSFIVGSTYLETHEPEKAIKFAEKSYELDKKDPEILFLRGRAYILMAVKENAPATVDDWKNIVPVFSKKENLLKGQKDIDSVMEIATKDNLKSLLPSAYFLQKMVSLWLGEDVSLSPPDIENFGEEKQFFQFYDAFKKREYEYSYSLLKGLKEYGKMPYEEKLRLGRAYLYRGQPEIAKELFDSVKEEAIKKENCLFWIDYSIITTLLGEKNQAILAAAKAREVAKGDKMRRVAFSHYGAVMLHFVDSKEGDRVLEGAQAFQKEFPDVKILTAFDFKKEKDKIITMIKEKREWAEKIRDIYNEKPLLSYFLQDVFKEPYVFIWAGRDPNMPFQFTITTNEFYEEMEKHFKEGSFFVFDYLSLLTLSKLNLLSELENIFPEMRITFSLFDKIQNELLRFENENLRRLWNFLRKSKVIKIEENLKDDKNKSKINSVFEPWLIDIIALAKVKGAVLVTDDFRFLRYSKSVNIKSINSWLIIKKAQSKKLLDSSMYSRTIGKLAECFYTFISFDGDNLFEIAFQDDFKLTARIYHLINQAFLPGSIKKSFTEVFLSFIIRLWRPGMIIDDKIFWLDYLTKMGLKLLDPLVKNLSKKEENISLYADIITMWKVALRNGSKEDLVVLRSKVDTILSSKEQEYFRQRIKEEIDQKIESFTKKEGEKK